MSTPKEFFAAMDEELQKIKGLDAIYQFDITGDNGGQWYVDALGDEPVIGEGQHENPSATFSADAEDFMAIATGKMPSQMAFMMGKLKVSGDMALAIRLQKIFP